MGKLLPSLGKVYQELRRRPHEHKGHKLVQVMPNKPRALDLPPVTSSFLGSLSQNWARPASSQIHPCQKEARGCTQGLPLTFPSAHFLLSPELSQSRESYIWASVS